MTQLSLEDFTREWQGQITKIENTLLDDHAVTLIRLNFDMNRLKFKMFLTEERLENDDVYLKLDLLESKLEIALQSANCRFKIENRGVWAKAFHGFFDKASKLK